MSTQACSTTRVAEFSSTRMTWPQPVVSILVPILPFVAGMLHHVQGVVHGVDVTGLDARVAALVEVEDVAIGERDLVAALFGADDPQALVLAVVR